MKVGLLTRTDELYYNLSMIPLYQKARRDYTEITMARKNIDIILNRGHDGAHDFLERDERERSK